MIKLITCTICLSLALTVANTVEAKNPKKSERGSGLSTHGSANSHGLGSNSWSGSAPGWNSGGLRSGWGDSGGTPPGWGKSTTRQGWDSLISPLLKKRK